MKGGILEVLLVSAQGIRHTNLIGKPSYFVKIECGNQVRKSKASTGNHEEIYWNEKFRFEFPLSEWENLTHTHLKFKIMDEEYFSDGGFVGETMVYLGGIIMEGSEKGQIEVISSPYNVVLEDDTYKGEIKIGLRFTLKEILQVESRECVEEERENRKSLCTTIFGLWRIPWWRFLFSRTNTHSKHGQKKN